MVNPAAGWNASLKVPARAAPVTFPALLIEARSVNTVQEITAHAREEVPGLFGATI